MPNISEIAVGQQIVEQNFHITRDSLVRYAGASGDFNPIHYRDDVAKSVGLPGVLAHGMLTMGLSITPVISWAGSSSAIVDYSVRFTKPVVVPSDVAAEVKVTATIGVIDLEKKQARVDLITSFEGSSVLGKAQAWVQL
jgi:acyl dehydratase